MSSLTNKKISSTYKGLLKTADESTLSATPKAITDGDGNNSGVLLDNSGNLKVNNTVEFGSLKDAGEDITIEKFVDEADGIANNDNDTSLPTSAAVKNYVDSTITAEDLDFSGNDGTGDVDLNSEVFAITGSNGITTTALDNTLDIDGSTLQTAINTNTSNIATNSADISTNSTNISTNAGNISTNASDIATNLGNITTNATNIASNDVDIASNAANIATNTTNISDNAADITTNEANISTNTASIATNTADIATNTGNISQNSTDIATNATNIASNDTDISALQTDVGTNTSNISQNTTNIATNASGISTNTSNISTNTSNISSNTTNIATNTSNVATNAADIATNESNITTNAANISTNADGVSTNTTNIASNDADIAALQTSVGTNTTGIATNASAIATNTTSISDNAAAIAINNAKNSYPSEDATKVGFISVTQAVNLDTMESNIATNNAKVSNVTTDLSATATETSLTINSSDGTNASIPAATTSAWGAMTDEDKTKLNGIATGATANTGTVTEVTVGTGLDVINGTTTPEITVDLAELTDMTDAMLIADEFVVIDASDSGTKRKQVNEIGLNLFSNAVTGFVTTSGFTMGNGAKITLPKSGAGSAAGDEVLFLNHTSSFGGALNLRSEIQNGSFGSYIHFLFTHEGSTAGSIARSGNTSVSYNTSSDYRLKENVIDITDGIDRVKQLKPSKFNFIGEDRIVDGFIAHEVQEVIPEAITGTKDEIDDDDNPIYQGIDQSKMVPLLTAALQEAIAKIEDLEARIQTLENA